MEYDVPGDKENEFSFFLSVEVIKHTHQVEGTQVMHQEPGIDKNKV